MILKATAFLGTCLLFMSCQSTPDTSTNNAPTKPTVKDSHTLSNADSIGIQHLDLDLQVQMDQHIIAGNATWTIDNKNKISSLHLDTDGLIIDSVKADNKTVTFTLNPPTEYLGNMLAIPIQPTTKKVTIYYKTQPTAKALQWLAPQQTHDKKSPFLYTQSEAIYARSWIPCPDGPGIRFSYNARIQTQNNLLALMSATNPQAKNDSGIYHFTMETPIPAYLMALAVGDITFKSIDARTGVYAEPGMIDKVKYEFDEVGKMVSTAEQLYGPYQWGRYDVIVLPPGFPIGGMENPRLTFCTPTVIAGDRSLVTLIAHELAHSWSGNLVTNATWNDIWLNEGFTVYFERRIMEQMMGKTYADMLWELGYQDLDKEVTTFGATSKDTWLKLNLLHRDPDDGLSDIPYEKGALFLQLIEQTVGRQEFDKFLAQYFHDHAFKTINTEDFLTYLDSNLLHHNKEWMDKINIDAWVYGPGIPPNCPRAPQERFKKVDEQREIFLNTATTALQTKEWTTHEWLHFLRKMPATIATAQMENLDKAFHFSASTNSEIADLWYTMAIKAKYTPAYAPMEKFLSSVGRRKFLMPLYEQMIATAEGKKMANTFFGKYKNNYHPLAQESIGKLLANVE